MLGSSLYDGNIMKQHGSKNYFLMLNETIHLVGKLTSRYSTQRQAPFVMGEPQRVNR